MKRFIPHVILSALVASCIACTSLNGPATPAQQQAINSTYASYAALDQAILAADAAVKAGTLKGADAKRTLAGLQAAKAGLDTALTAMTLPASGVSK